MTWNRSLQPWTWAGPENIELLERPIASPPPVLILAVPHRFNEPMLRGRRGMPFGRKQEEGLRGSVWNAMGDDVDGIEEEGRAEEPVQRGGRQPVNQRLVPRPVQGPVLSDQQGRLYEKHNEQVRLLGRVIKGAHGRLFELVPQDEPSCAEHDANEKRREEIDNDPKAGSHSNVPSKEYVQLFPGQEITRIVRFGEVKGLLLSQVMEPNRMRDDHRLLCRVELFEVTRSQSMESFASTLLSETGIAGQLQLLTEVMTHKLQLTEVLGRRAPARQVETRQPGMLLSGDRVFRLILVNDPTSDRHAMRSSKPKMAAGSKEFDDKGRSSSEPLNHDTPLKTAIPERFLKPWEFQISREEALYDMSVQGRNPSFLDRFRGWRRSGEELRKWQALLVGKKLDDQLWGVRLPMNAFHHSEVRAWAQRTLQQAGYNVGVMLPEWEVYWRRKGV